MKRWLGAMLGVLAMHSAFAQTDVPLPEDAGPLEIEPPLLIQSRGPDGLPVVPAPPEKVELAKLESDLAKAKKRAASGEGLYRAGIIAKVDAEERALKVVRLEAQLAEARLAEAKSNSEEETSEETSTIALAEAKEAAERATKERQRAELEAALRNLQRQQKLLALGSGRRSDVTRAEKKLAELQGAGN